MENLIKKIEELKQRFLDNKNLLNIPKKEEQEGELRLKMSEPNFWQNKESAAACSKEAEHLSAEIKPWSKLENELTDIFDFAVMAQEEKNNDLQTDLESRFADLERKFDDLEFLSLFSGEYDNNGAIVSIHAGTGGVDAQDWAQMLERMYLRFCERQGLKIEILDCSYGNEAGIKSVVLRVSGKWAYAYFKSENGVHRLLRNSPFNADGLRQTSFALVEVIPEIPDNEQVILKDEELRIDVFRSSGPGGQSVNTTDSAVRITHLPSGLVVSCQTERSQHQNKENALKILKTKLYQQILVAKEAKEKDLKGGIQKAEWGQQVRSYFLYGNRLVKDHRTNIETSNVDQVLDGDLKIFIEAYLRFLKK